MIRGLLSLLALLLLAGCAGSGITIPELPRWPAASVVTVPSATIEAEVRARWPDARFYRSDDRYVVVSHAWLESYLNWTWSAAKAAGVGYTPESWDCDDFALAFTLFASRAAAKAGVHAAPLMARIVVVQTEATPSMARSLHELVGVVTDRGIFIVEPQPDAGPFRVTPITKYSRPVLTVILGDKS
jgi:hypothetical protein